MMDYDEFITMMIIKRKSLNMSQEKLARALDVSKVTIANIEQLRQRPSFHLFMRICSALYLKIDITDIAQ